MKFSIKGKYLYLLVIGIVTLLTVVLVPTYAKFTDNYVTDDDIVGFNFDFDIEISNIEEYEEIEVLPGEMTRFNVDVSNDTGELVYYGIWYKLVGMDAMPSDNSIQIGKLKGSNVPSSGSINNGENVTVSLGIINSTNNVIKMYVGVGSSDTSINDIEYLGGKKLITGEVNIVRDITISSITIDGKISDSLPKSGIYTMKSTCSRGTVLNWDTYNKSITYSVGAKAKDICSLTFTNSNEYPLLNTMKVGSYVRYVGSGGKVGNTEVNCQVVTDTNNKEEINENEAINSCIGQNVNENLDNSKYTYGYTGSNNYKYHTTGWRIAYIKDGKVMLVSAGAPEEVYKAMTLDNNSHIGKLNASVMKYCNKDFVDGECVCNSSVNGMCDSASSDVWAISDNDFYYMTKAISGFGKRLTPTSSNLGDVGGSIGETLYCYKNFSSRECGYNNSLIDNGSAYWFVSDSYDGSVFWNPNGRYVSSVTSNVHYGLRPIISLSKTVYVTGGSGTMEDPYTIGN